MRYILVTIILFLYSTGLFSQATISLNTARTTGGTLTACQQVTLGSGFSFKATATSSLTLRVNPSTCDPYGGSTSSVSSNQNYIQTKTYTTDNGSRYLESIQYFDGLGRPVQTVQRAVTPNTGDLVTWQEYDPFGRESNSWLPVAIASNNGAFADLTKVKANITKTYPNETAPYSKPVYEASPLNRVLEQYGPGADWHTNKKAVKTEYLANSPEIVDGGAALSCRKYTVTGSALTTQLTYAGAAYDTGQLYVTRMTDEDGNKVYEFKDKLGQVLLTRAINVLPDKTIQHLNTLYVYDDFGNLSYVIPPEGFDKIKDYSDNSTEMKRYAYLYKYDTRNRCIWKRLPGCEPIFYVYDKADRLIFSQDGEQRTKNEWAFSIPDVFGRIVLTGISKNTLNYAADPLKAVVVKATWAGGTTTTKGFTVSGVTLSSPVVLSASYYDSYSFMGVNGIPAITDANIKPEAIAGYGTRYTGGYKGMLTGTLTAQMNADGTVSSGYLYSVMYYDSRGRLIQTKSNNHLTGGIEKEYIAYNFTGQPTKKMHIHSATGKTTQTEVYAYSYDHAGRMVKETHQLNGGTTVTLAQNTYDELGRLKTIQKHTHANLKTTYGYNVRSWTKTISSPLFAQTLYYNESYGGSKAQYNGNISAMAWRISNESTQGYAFAYDNLSRLTNAGFLINAVANIHYKTAYTYDKQGNMKTLQRYGRLQDMNVGLVDNITMTYTGNQLTKAEDAGPTISRAESMDFKNYSNAAIEYAYNANGAMTKDLNKGITGIQYNSLNLPRQMDIKSPVAEARNEYTYNVGGQKLKVVQKWNPNYSTTPVIGSTINTASLTQTKTTDYVGNKVYENGVIRRILVDGGYIEGNTYHFYQTDHLGNNRAVAKTDGTLVQKTHYYPFGSSFGVATGSSTQPYRYNGKELDQMHGLNLYDYSARYYESAIGRFTSVDPMAEKYYSISPYVYCNNNPLKYVDPTGMAYGDYYDSFTGQHIYNDGIDDDKVYVRITANRQAKEDGRIGGFREPYKDIDIPIGFKSKIQDKTELFNAQLESTNTFFSEKREEIPIYKKLSFFSEQVTDKSPYDIKTADGPFNETNKDNWSKGYAFFDGKLLRSDDFGNFNFGVAAKAFGIPETLGVFGAGYKQVENHFGDKKSPLGGLSSFLDDNKDNYMIKQGYKYYNQNFKK